MTNAPPLPVTLVSGYLGAGKTTLVNHLLRHPEGRRLMVLVNDFGDLAIDSSLIESQDDGLLTLSNGCVCCSLGSDLFDAFSAVLDRDPGPDHLIVEASGIARPGNIANIARAEPDLRLDSMVTLVDAEQIEDNLADPLITATLEEQIATADLLLVNKADLVTADRLEAVRDRLAAIAGGAPVLSCSNGVVDIETLLGSGNAMETRSQSNHHHHHDHADAYVRWSHECMGLFDIDRLREGLSGLPKGLLRFKGIINSPAGPVAVHRVGRRVSVERFEGPAPALSQMVAIGLQGRMDPQQVERTVLQALR